MATAQRTLSVGSISSGTLSRYIAGRLFIPKVNILNMIQSENFVSTIQRRVHNEPLRGRNSHKVRSLNRQPPTVGENKSEWTKWVGTLQLADAFNVHYSL